MRWDPDPGWPIGVFDSGLGGLTVWRALRRRLPRNGSSTLPIRRGCPMGNAPQRRS